MEFKVDIDVFSGPLDLLLYLVRKHEVDVTEVPIAQIASEFVAHVSVLEQLAIDDVGEFVDLASVLLEIKSRALVPRPEEPEEPVLAREDLVRRLLEYKQYRDAATLLEDRGRQWELRFPRLSAETAPASGPPPVAVADAHVWDLVGAMARVLDKRERRRPRQIIHDETPLETHVETVEALVRERGRVAFGDLFDHDMPRSRMVGLFLAVLELVRRGRLRTCQERLFGEILLEQAPPRDPPAPPQDASTEA